ncbi:uncharacterized protein LOC112457708 [Temnothorax curvispinosus]|uniref:Uncharacterized protein LOC112457708 n=1 Tax=Temnothorax curvispinosus TaxID=300111 RepID=A0A6J1Q3B6_9HYME|nr:uncharacterized protein LOC112457708 [Temnothorax curvispinosus]
MDGIAEYRCAACKKSIKNLVVKCKACAGVFYHPGCVTKHKIQDGNREIISCPGPFEKIMIEDEKEMEKNKTRTTTGRPMGATGVNVAASGNGSAKATGPAGTDVKIDLLIKTVKEIKNEMVCKKEIRTIIKEIIQQEIGIIKQEMENLKRMMMDGTCGASRKYSEAVKEKKKENILIIKPKAQQESKDTKKIVKEKIDIKNMEVGISKLRKGGGGSVILGCETDEEMKTLKDKVQATMGEDFKVNEPQWKKPKIKVINVGEDEIKMDDDKLLDAIKRQNRIEDTAGEDLFMRIVKRMYKRRDKNNERSNGKRREEEGSLILEVDNGTHEAIIKRGKLNIGWRKCIVYNFISVVRCYKCWGYFHMAKNCTRQEACFKCAGYHKVNECTAAIKNCVNCTYKNKTYNLKLNTEHEAIDSECPTFKKILEEEKRRAGWEDSK